MSDGSREERFAAALNDAEVRARKNTTAGMPERVLREVFAMEDGLARLGDR